MFDWIRRLLGKTSEPSVENRSLKEGDDITDDEADFILAAIRRKHGPVCPDCQQGYFIAGPSGGESTNVRCDACGSEFNLCVAFGEAVFGERLTNKGSADPTRDWCYKGKSYYGNTRPEK